MELFSLPSRPKDMIEAQKVQAKMLDSGKTCKTCPLENTLHLPHSQTSPAPLKTAWAHQL